MGTSNSEFEIETTVDLDNVDEGAAQELLKRASNPLPREEEVLTEDARTQKTEAGPSVDELENYSENVKKRIDKLTFDREEASRRAAQAARERDEAMQYAQRAMEDRKQFELSLIHISEPTRPCGTSRMPSSA